MKESVMKGRVELTGMHTGTRDSHEVVAGLVTAMNEIPEETDAASRTRIFCAVICHSGQLNITISIPLSWKLVSLVKSKIISAMPVLERRVISCVAQMSLSRPKSVGMRPLIRTLDVGELQNNDVPPPVTKPQKPFSFDPFTDIDTVAEYENLSGKTARITIT